MITDGPTRDRILAKLKNAGWISGFEVRTDDKTPNMVSMKIDWTDYGKQRRKDYHAMFEELGFSGPQWGGQFEALYEVCKISPYEKMGQPGDHPTRG